VGQLDQFWTNRVENTSSSAGFLTRQTARKRFQSNSGIAAVSSTVTSCVTRLIPLSQRGLTPMPGVFYIESEPTAPGTRQLLKERLRDVPLLQGRDPARYALRVHPIFGA
jgi:hypothetical protein